MSNYVPLYDAVAAQHRQDLLREAEQERMAREATAAGMEVFAGHVLRGVGRQVLATAGLLVVLVTGGLAACGAQATAAPHAGAKPAATAPATSSSPDVWPASPAHGPR